jgi:probable F420-dependent oxidoreductase
MAWPVPASATTTTWDPFGRPIYILSAMSTSRLTPDRIGQVRDRLGPLGIWTGGFNGVPVAEARSAAATLEAHGAGSITFDESYGREAFTQAAVLLGATERAIVTTGIANIHARDTTAARGAQATLDAASGGRFLLGLGVSHQPLVERYRGGRYDSPLATMRAYLEGVDAASVVAPDAEPAGPRLLAALGPKMLALAGELADGAMPYLVTPEHTAQARQVLGPDKLLVVEQSVTLADDAEEHRRRAHQHLEVYTGLPNYRNSWLRLGFDESDLGRGGSARLRDALVPQGVDASLAAVRAHVDAGADHVVVQVIGEHPLALPLADMTRLLDAGRTELAG